MPVVTCHACPLSGAHRHTRQNADQLARTHDRVLHGGQPTARVRRDVRRAGRRP